MYEQPYPIHKFPCVGTTVARRLAQLGKQLAERGELHPPVPLFEFIPEVTRRFESRDMNADVGGQVPEDGVVGLGFAARPFTVALERLDLHFEARFNRALPHRPDQVRFHQYRSARTFELFEVREFRRIESNSNLDFGASNLWPIRFVKIRELRTGSRTNI